MVAVKLTPRQLRRVSKQHASLKLKFIRHFQRKVEKPQATTGAGINPAIGTSVAATEQPLLRREGAQAVSKLNL